MRTFIVYCHTSRITGKKYVGQTVKSLMLRWRQHIADSKRSDFIFHRAIVKYGPDAWDHEILEVMTTEAGAKAAETLWIKLLNTNARVGGVGYNMTDGGDGTLGHVPTEKTRRKIARTLTGRKASTETRAKQSLAKLGRKPSGRSLRGVPKTAEHRARIAAANMGHRPNDATRAKMSESAKHRCAKASQTLTE